MPSPPATFADRGVDAEGLEVVMVSDTEVKEFACALDAAFKKAINKINRKNNLTSLGITPLYV